MQTSSKDLSKRKQHHIFRKLATLLADLKTEQDVYTFLTSFLTDTEQVVFAKRLAIISMLGQNKSYDEIRKALHVSSATISNIASEMDSPGFTKASHKLAIDDWAERQAKKVSKWLPF